MQVIAGFNRVRMLTPDLAIIVEAMRGSATTELAATGLGLRPRDSPTRWVLPMEQRDAPAAYAQVVPPAASAEASPAQQALPDAAAPASEAGAAAAGGSAAAGYTASAAGAASDADMGGAAQHATAAPERAAQPGQGQEPAPAEAAAQQPQRQQQEQQQSADMAAPATPVAAASSAANDAKPVATSAAEEHDDMFQLDEVGCLRHCRCCHQVLPRSVCQVIAPQPGFMPVCSTQIR